MFDAISCKARFFSLFIPANFFTFSKTDWTIGVVEAVVPTIQRSSVAINGVIKKRQKDDMVEGQWRMHAQY